MSLGEVDLRPLAPARWGDLERLFGANGACGGCWCMFYRQSCREFRGKKSEQNRAAFRQIVDSGEEPGIIAYVDGEPAGWCAVAPREKYPRLERSRVLARVDGAKVWSIVCLYVAKSFRRRGLTEKLLRGAAEFARERGACMVEGYPVDQAGDAPATFLWNGIASTFRKAGFYEVLRRSPKRPIMRLMLSGQKADLKSNPKLFIPDQPN